MGSWAVRSPGGEAFLRDGEAAEDGGASLEGGRPGWEWAPRFQKQGGGWGGAQEGGIRGQGRGLESCRWGAGDEAYLRGTRASREPYAERHKMTKMPHSVPAPGRAEDTCQASREESGTGLGVAELPGCADRTK